MPGAGHRGSRRAGGGADPDDDVANGRVARPHGETRRTSGAFEPGYRLVAWLAWVPTLIAAGIRIRRTGDAVLPPAPRCLLPHPLPAEPKGSRCRADPRRPDGSAALARLPSAPDIPEQPVFTPYSARRTHRAVGRFLRRARRRQCSGFPVDGARHHAHRSRGILLQRVFPTSRGGGAPATHARGPAIALRRFRSVAIQSSDLPYG